MSLTSLLTLQLDLLAPPGVWWSLEVDFTYVKSPALHLHKPCFTTLWCIGGHGINELEFATFANNKIRMTLDTLL